MYKEAMEKLLERKDLSRNEMRDLMEDIMNGELTDIQIAGFLMAMRVKGETKEEIVGSAMVMRQKSSQIRVESIDAIDTCGTGGDGKHTFNVSTMAAVVACAAGVTVVKHGNRSVSSKCGSADILHQLGVRIDLDVDRAADCLDKTNMAFLFAPTYHPFMKHVMTARNELGVRTIFNILGPLSNPGLVKNQILGVFDPNLTVLFAEVLQELGLKRALVVHGMDGLDEISIAAETKITELRDGEIQTYEVKPEDFGFLRGCLADMEGGTPKENAEMMMALLYGKRSMLRDMVVLNSGAAIYVGGKAGSISDGIQMAETVIDSGEALRKFDAFRKATNLGGCTTATA